MAVKSFPRIHWLRKIFNRNTIKVRYSCMCNIQQFIKKYNNFIQNKRNKITLSCDCRDKNECKLNGNCRTENVIYKYPSKKVGTTTIKIHSKTKIIKTVPFFYHICGASNQHLRKKMLTWVVKWCDRLFFIQTFQSDVCYVCMKS